ncbi:MAG: hypothetical protein ACPHF4_14980 [Rubripirellula sp.]
MRSRRKATVGLAFANTTKKPACMIRFAATLVYLMEFSRQYNFGKDSTSTELSAKQ